MSPTTLIISEACQSFIKWKYHICWFDLSLSPNDFWLFTRFKEFTYGALWQASNSNLLPEQSLSKTRTIRSLSTPLQMIYHINFLFNRFIIWSTAIKMQITISQVQVNVHMSHFVQLTVKNSVYCHRRLIKTSKYSELLAFFAFKINLIT